MSSQPPALGTELLPCGEGLGPVQGAEMAAQLLSMDGVDWRWRVKTQLRLRLVKLGWWVADG